MTGNSPSEKEVARIAARNLRNEHGCYEIESTDVSLLLSEIDRLNNELARYRGIPKHWVGLDGEDGDPVDPRYVRAT